MSGQPLTSLRESPLPDLLSKPLDPSDKDNQKLAEVREEINTFYKTRDDLREEVRKLNIQIAKDRDTAKSSTELKRLKIQKSIILTQIKELATLLETLTGKKSDLLESLEAYGQERTGDLVDISNRIVGELGEVNQELTRKSGQLTEEEGLLAEMAPYYEKLAVICESSASDNEQKGLELDKRAIDIVLTEKKTSEGLKIAKDQQGLTGIRLKEAEERYKDADLMASRLEKDFEGEKERLDKLAKELSLKEKTLKLEREALKTREKVVHEREIGASDQWRTIQRTVKALKEKGCDII